ncbi:MAG: hypothetical protein H6581_25110 [Bacteroidia bacterium]|nr:hypothetical protein [Bacteroidia bacterium]
MERRVPEYLFTNLIEFLKHNPMDFIQTRLGELFDRPPLEITQKFIHEFWGDESQMEAVERDMRQLKEQKSPWLEIGLRALEAVLVDPGISDQKLISLVEGDANYPLENPSGATARAWLVEAAAMIRRVIV